MSETIGWMDEAYKEAFETELRGLKRRCEHDPNCTVEELKGTLKALYVFQGNNWDGRGEVYELGLAATIAAHEYFIDEMENNQKKST